MPTFLSLIEKAFLIADDERAEGDSKTEAVTLELAERILEKYDDGFEETR